MREKIFLRIAKTKTGYLYKVDKKKNDKALDSGVYDRKAYPTIIVALNLEVPDELFEKALIELDLNIEHMSVANVIKIEESLE